MKCGDASPRKKRKSWKAARSGTCCSASIIPRNCAAPALPLLRRNTRRRATAATASQDFELVHRPSTAGFFWSGKHSTVSPPLDFHRPEAPHYLAGFVVHLAHGSAFRPVPRGCAWARGMDGTERDLQQIHHCVWRGTGDLDRIAAAEAADG